MTYPSVAFEDAFNLLCGKQLGSGIHRDVFECRIRPDMVVKVENSEEWRNFANVREHQFWADHEYVPAVAKWLAPCEYLSPDGRISLQRKAAPVQDSDMLPEKIPAFLTDLKRENFGWLNGQLVAVDYALTIVSASTRLRKVDWPSI